MSGLSDRIEREPEYRPHCLNCDTMRRMTLIDKRVMWCEPVIDDTFSTAARAMGLAMPNRYGCDYKFDIFTGEQVRPLDHKDGEISE